VLFSFWRAEVRWAAVLLSSGIGLPSAVEGASEVDDVFSWKSGGKGKGSGKEALLGWEAGSAGEGPGVGSEPGSVEDEVEEKCAVDGAVTAQWSEGAESRSGSAPPGGRGACGFVYMASRNARRAKGDEQWGSCN
jgi:hypothetical protein